jgi:hypothetical protein
MKTYSKEEFWKLHEKLPQELKDALWAPETGDAIYEACKRHEATDYLESIVELTGHVLMGLLLPQDFQEAVEKLGVKKEAAKDISHEINRFVFYPVKPALEQLHRMEIEVTAKVVTPQPPEESEEKPEEPRGEDRYREQLE